MQSAYCITGNLRGPHLSWGLSLITSWTVPIPAPRPCTLVITGEECERHFPKLQLGRSVHLVRLYQPSPMGRRQRWRPHRERHTVTSFPSCCCLSRTLALGFTDCLRKFLDMLYLDGRDLTFGLIFLRGYKSGSNLWNALCKLNGFQITIGTIHLYVRIKHL